MYLIVFDILLYTYVYFNYPIFYFNIIIVYYNYFQAELVQQNNLSSDDRELHNIEEKMYKDKQIKDNLIVNKFKELYNDDEHSLKQMLNAIEMTDVVKIAYKENWQLVLEHLQNPEFGYEVI